MAVERNWREQLKETGNMTCSTEPQVGLQPRTRVVTLRIAAFAVLRVSETPGAFLFRECGCYMLQVRSMLTQSWGLSSNAYEWTQLKIIFRAVSDLQIWPGPFTEANQSEALSLVTLVESGWVYSENIWNDLWLCRFLLIFNQHCSVCDRSVDCYTFLGWCSSPQDGGQTVP